MKTRTEARMFGKGKEDKKPDDEKEQHSPEKQKKIDDGFEYLVGLENLLDKDKDDKISLEEAQEIASKTKQKFTVFSSIVVIIEGNRIVYEYTASPKKKRNGNKSVDSNKSSVSRLKSWQIARPEGRLITDSDKQITKEEETAYDATQKTNFLVN